MRGPLLLLLLVAAACGSEADAAADADADAATSCDPAAQTGCPAGMKCTFVAAGDGFATACRAVSGAGAEGQPCTRGAGGHGDDTCAPGLFCTFIGVLPVDRGGTRYCRAICDDTHACPASGQTCARLTDGPVAGMCGPSCAPLAATCADGMTCAEVWSGLDGDLDLFAVCRPAGAVGAGEACTGDTDCVADHVCLELPGAPVVCRPLSDVTHPCAAGSCFQPSGSTVGACL